MTRYLLVDDDTEIRNPVLRGIAIFGAVCGAIGVLAVAIVVMVVALVLAFLVAAAIICGLFAALAWTGAI